MPRYATGEFLEINLKTDGSLHTPGIVSCLLDSCNTFVISADGENHEWHEKMRVNGNCERIVPNLEMLRDAVVIHQRRKRVRVRVFRVSYSEEAQDYER
jgi:MoaA/NifB/PqqE/SkfB family radical SAM enzyme